MICRLELSRANSCRDAVLLQPQTPPLSAVPEKLAGVQVSPLAQSVSTSHAPQTPMLLVAVLLAPPVEIFVQKPPAQDSEPLVDQSQPAS
jgi:hypothetical protein